jgi:hypothetical protein
VRAYSVENSLDLLKWANQQNNFPPKCHSGNNVCQLAYGQNSVPSFQGDIRMACQLFTEIPGKRFVQP